MKRSTLLTLTLMLLVTVTLACGGERAAAGPDGTAASPETAPAPEKATAPAGQPAQPAGTPPPPTAQAGAAPPPLTGTEMSLDPNAPAAKVNGVPISVKDLDQAMAQFLRSQGAPPDLPPDQVQQARRIVLDALVGSELLYQRSKADGITATQEEIDKVIAEARKPFPTEEAWQANLKQQGLDTASMTALVSRNVGIDKIIKRDVLDKVAVSEEDLAKYYNEHPDQMKKEEEVRASHILFRTPEGAAEEARKPVRSKAEAMLARAKAGEDFSALAKEGSEDPGSAQQGGDLGFFKRGMMVPPFESAAFALAVGQISDLVESPFGYHIIKVTDKHAAGTATLDEVREPLRGFLQQQQARQKMQVYIDSLKAAARVETF